MNVRPYTVLKHFQPETVAEDGTVTAEYTYYSLAFQGNEIKGYPGTASWDGVEVVKVAELLNHAFHLGATTALLRNREPSSDNFDQQY